MSLGVLSPAVVYAGAETETAQEDENGQETADVRESADTSAAVQPELNFTEDSQMLCRSTVR